MKQYIYSLLFILIIPTMICSKGIHFPLFVGPQTNSSTNNNSSSHTYIIPTPIFSTGWHHDFSYNSYSGPIERPKTIIGNTLTALIGTMFASFGTFVSGMGFYTIVQALFMKDQYSEYNPDDITIGRIQDGFIGTTIGCFGLIFTIYGAHELKESLTRIYKIWKKLPLDEKHYTAID